MRKSKRKSSSSGFLIFIALLIIAAALAYRKWHASSPEYEISNLKELPDGFKSYGIDVSHHQGTIDWDALFEKADTLIEFVYCKATEGINHVDKEWKYNRDILLERNIKHGAYHFFLPNKNGIEQAQHFLRHYSEEQTDLPPVLDVETEAESDASLINAMKAWLLYVEDKTGKRPVIYTSYNFYSEKFMSAFEGYKFWIANYSDKEFRFRDDAIIHWQFTDKGLLPGIEGHVDLNFSKIDFVR